ncbi:MAG: glucosidase, partial [Bacteroidota bacterium]|nr:glucosidase [Bacteroidota bacterium]
SWMGMYALNMMDMAIEIAIYDTSFEDTATKFFEHFVLIAEAMNELGMWNDEDKFYYDTLAIVNESPKQLRIKSIVGLTAIFAVSVIETKVLNKLEDFNKRINWFERYRKLNQKFWPNEERAGENKILISLIPKERLIALLQRVLDESEFLSPGGIRALSKHHEQNPYSIQIDYVDYSIQYEPGDSTSDFYGGNSNWRGPVWIPINYLLIESIRKYGEFYGDTLKIEYPTRSGNYMNLLQVSNELAKRTISLFKKDGENKRCLHGDYNWFYSRPENQDLLLFYEYFHGDTGRGLGAAHQTGWTSLVASLLVELAEEKK